MKDVFVMYAQNRQEQEATRCVQVPQKQNCANSLRMRAEIDVPGKKGLNENGGGGLYVSKKTCDPPHIRDAIDITIQNHAATP